jgi:hypothetical protein
MEANPARPDHVLVIHWLLMDTNMTKDETLQMCLEYIETDAHERKYVRHAIKAALEAKDEPEQMAKLGWQVIDCPICGGGARAFPKQEAKDEPVAWYVERQHEGFRDHGLKYGPFWKRDDALEWCDDNHFLKNLYTTPPQRKPLTDEKFKHMPELFVVPPHHVEMVVRAIEAAHGIKGEA